MSNAIHDAERRIELNEALRTIQIGQIVKNDKNANRIVLELLKDRKPAELDGYSVTGKFINHENVMVPLEGTIEGNILTVTFNEGCYVIPGMAGGFIIVSNADASDIVTVAQFTADVLDDGGDKIYDPNHMIGSVTELLAKIAAMEKATADGLAAAAKARSAADEADAAREAIQGDLGSLKDHSTSVSDNYFDAATMLMENKRVDPSTGELSDTQSHNVLVMPIIANVRCSAYRWDSDSGKMVAVSGYFALFDSNGEYKIGSNQPITFEQNYDGYAYVQISKATYGDGEIMFVRGQSADYIPDAYVPYKLGFTMEKIENLPALNARVEKLERVCVPGITAIKEIYLTGVDTSRDLSVTQFRKAYYNGTNYIYSLRIAYADSETAIAQFMLSTPEPSDEFTEKRIVELTPYNSTVSGYACVDYSSVPDGVSMYTAQPINKMYVTNLADTPNIHAYLISRGAIDNIVALNKDMEPAVINASKSRSSKFADSIAPLEFVHFSDVHAQLREWQRIVEYINGYDKYLSFALHTGDYVGVSMESFVDLYAVAKPKNVPILNSCGNHDTYQNDTSPMGEATQEETFNALFVDAENWGVTFGDEANAMYYYKDFAESNVRLIVLDEWHWTDAQAAWLDDVLSEAKSAGYHVVTAAHTVTAKITEDIECGFVPVDNVEQFNSYKTRAYESQIVAFKDAGGVHVCHLSGHYHYDHIGYSAAGVLNVIIECATHYNAHTESVRVEGTKTFDCFNVVCVDVNTNRLKIVRIGCNTNAALCSKNALCYDYDKKEVVTSH